MFCWVPKKSRFTVVWGLAGYQKTKSTNEHIYDEVGVGMFPCDAATIRLIKTQIRGDSLCPREGGFLESIAIFNDR